MNKNQFFKQLKSFVGLIRFDWKTWFLPTIIDIRKDNEKRQKEKKLTNVFFGVIFGSVAILGAVSQYPNIRLMISTFLIVAILYIGFCAIMNSLRIKVNSTGRKKKKKIGTFPELFYSKSDYEAVDQYVRTHYSQEKMISSSDCHTLLNIIIAEKTVMDDSLEPMVALFVKQYPDLFPQKISTRAITKAKIYTDRESQMKVELFQKSSKK